MSIGEVSLWIGAIIGVGTIIGGTIKFLFWLFDEIKRRRTSPTTGSAMLGTPRETLQIALKDDPDYWWHMGSQGDENIMQVVGDFLLTNVWSKPIRLLQMELRYGLLGRRSKRGFIMVEGERGTYGMHDIPPGDTRNSRADFWIFPPVKESGEDFVAHSVIFYDQFGNKHRVKKLRFHYS